MRFRVLFNKWPKQHSWVRSRWMPLCLGMGGSIYLTYSSILCENPSIQLDPIDFKVAKVHVGQKEILKPQDQTETQVSHSQVLKRLWKYIRSDWFLFGTVLQVF